MEHAGDHSTNFCRFSWNGTQRIEKEVGTAIGRIETLQTAEMARIFRRVLKTCEKDHLL